MKPIKKIPRSKHKKMGIVRSHPFIFTVIAVVIGLLAEGFIASGVDYVCDKTYKYFSAPTTALVSAQDNLVTSYKNVNLNDSRAMVYKKLGVATPKQRSYINEQGTTVEILFFPTATEDVTIRLENNQVTYINTSQGVPYETCMLNADKVKESDPFIVPINDPKIEPDTFNKTIGPDLETKAQRDSMAKNHTVFTKGVDPIGTANVKVDTNEPELEVIEAGK